MLEPVEFILTDKNTKHLKTPILGLLIVSLKKIGMKFNTNEFEPEMVINEWVKWGVKETQHWEVGPLHVKNYARQHDQENLILIPQLIILFLATMALFYLLLENNIRLGIITANVLILIKLIQSFAHACVPITTLAKPLLPENISDKNELTKTIRAHLEKFWEPFISSSKPGASHSPSMS